MGIVAKPHCTVVFLMVLTLGLCLGLPAEDVLDAVCDESESVPSEVIPVPSRMVPTVADTRIQSLLRPSHPELNVRLLAVRARVRNVDANRPADAESRLALLCAFLC